MKTLEERILHLENTITRMVALDEKRDMNYQQEIQKRADAAYVRDKENVEAFHDVVAGCDARMTEVEERIDTIEELLEDEE